MSNNEATPLFAAHPQIDMQGLIMRFAWEQEINLAFAYQNSAARLASTHTGDSTDDLILLPYLTLCRQAYELTLKVTIRSLASLRRTHLDDQSTELSRDRVNENLLRIGHDLLRLWKKVKGHFIVLFPDVDLPESLDATIRLLHRSDKSGTAFRYNGVLKPMTESVDFPSMAKRLDSELNVLISVLDYSTESFNY